MTTIVTRAGKGSALTHNEVDSNFTNLNSAKYESGNNVTFGTIGGTTITASTGFSGSLNGTVGASTPAAGTFTNLAYTGTLTGGTGVVNLGSGQIYKNASGDVGIGTSSPSQRLTVSGGNIGISNGRLNIERTSYPVIEINQSGSTGIGQFAMNGNNLEIRQTQAYDTLFYTNNTERMRIDSSGNVLVGSTSTSYAYAGYSMRWVGGVGGLMLSQGTTGTTNQIAFFNPNGNVGAINTSGSATLYLTSSDYRLKENIAPMTGALDTVAQLKPVTYKWKADGSDGQGFIAHELQAVVPDCVTGEKDAVDDEGNPVYQGVDTSFLVAILTKAIQELKAELDIVKAELNTLKGN